jgi:hypothetical protein
MVSHGCFIALGHPKGLLFLLPQFGMNPHTENVGWKILVATPGHPQFACQHSTRNPVENIILESFSLLGGHPNTDILECLPALRDTSSYAVKQPGCWIQLAVSTHQLSS